MIDWDKQKEKILFTIKHYGTRTKGEDFRLEQVAIRIAESTQLLFDAEFALRNANIDPTDITIYAN
jgi:hypothetical protein